MYFPNAFKKVFVPAIATGAINLKTTGNTAALTAGQIGLFDAKSYNAIAAAPSTGNQPFILAQGSYHTTDKIGPFHGGYKESIKSKVINPKYVSRFFKVAAQQPVNQIVEVSISKVEADKTYRLRVDIKGSPALRFLSRNIYQTLDAFTGCGEAGTLVDPTIVAIAWAKQLADEPLVKDFVEATVIDTNEDVVENFDTFTPDTTVNANQTAILRIAVAYVDTVFGNCSFTVTDKYDLEPLFIYTSFVDETGDPCAVNGISSEEVQAPVQASGVGETVLRDLILSDRYLQDSFPDGSHVDQIRLREVLDSTALGQVSRSGLYDQVCILHNVPRLHNPSSTFDNDQYLLVINVPTGTATTVFTDLIQDILDLAGNGVTLETY
jgi:hypothetical protein